MSSKRPARVDRPPHVPQGNEACADGGRGSAQRPLAVCREHDLVAVGERREQRGHVGLSSAHLGQRDHEQHSWTRGRVRHGGERTEA
jgi:hypothetical protein